MKLGLRCSETTNAHGQIRVRRDGLLHKIKGPAVWCPTGYQVWYLNGKQHREDGPARINHDRSVEYWLDDVAYDTKHLYDIEIQRRKAARGE